MQGWRQPQPSGTNRPSSYPSHPRGRCFMCLAGATHLRSKRDIRSGELAVRPPGHAEGSPRAWEARERHKTSAAHRSAAMAGGARPDPFRTRKLSRRAPMVLRGQPVGEQGAADRWTALDPFRAGRGGAAGDHLRGAPFFHLSAIKRPSRIYSFPFLAYRKTGRLYKGPPGPFFMPRFIFLMSVLSIYWDFAIRGNAGLL